MPRKKREVPADAVKVAVDKAAWEKAEALAGPRMTATEIVETGKVVQEQYGTSLVDEHAAGFAILEALAKKVDIPDDKPAGISLRDQAVLHLLAGADLHRVGEDVVEHRIKRCISIADLVVKMLGEDNGSV